MAKKPAIPYNPSMADRMTTHASMFNRTTAIIAAVLTAAFLLTLHFMGRIPVCTCGFGLFSADAWSPENSQMLIDPYSLSHILHGFIFFYVPYFFRKKLPLQWALLIAIGVEIGWEILENTPLVIGRYRETTASLNYFGDSILNSFGDLVSMYVGFFLAARLSWKIILALFVIIEVVMLFTIRDNLTLNILMLVYPVQAISDWQLSH